MGEKEKKKKGVGDRKKCQFLLFLLQINYKITKITKLY
jgi:hypothetical protein